MPSHICANRLNALNQNTISFLFDVKAISFFFFFEVTKNEQLSGISLGLMFGPFSFVDLLEIEFSALTAALHQTQRENSSQ